MCASFLCASARLDHGPQTPALNRTRTGSKSRHWKAQKWFLAEKSDCYRRATLFICADSGFTARTPIAVPFVYGIVSSVARTYDEDEVAAILSDAAKRAAERPDGSGVTLAELEDVAREAGLDRALVRAAATKVDRVEEPARGGRWAGTSTRLTARVRVDGPVDLDELAGGLFAEMADRVGDPGLEREVGEDRVWQTAHFGKGAGAGRGQQLSLTLRPTAGDAELVLREDVDREATIGIALRTALGAAVGAIATFIVGRRAGTSG